MSRTLASWPEVVAVPDGAWWVEDLRTDGLVEPLAILPRRPALSWVARSGRNEARQQGYRVRVHTDGRELWDSGDRAGEDIRIDYPGPELDTVTRYTWEVTLVDDQGSTTTATSWFETGLNAQTGPDAQASWGANWITPDADTLPAPLLRREFAIRGRPVRARLFVAGLGLHRCTINGVRVTDAELESGTTDFDHTVLYSGYDVTGLLDAGPAAIGVELGRGFYAMTTENVCRWHLAPWRAERKLLLRLEVTDRNGRVQMVGSDENWRWTEGPTRFDSFYEGETYDGRHDPGGWDHPGFDAAHWRPVTTATPPRGTLVPRTHEPVRVVRELSPTAWTRAGERAFVADLGDTIAGWARIDTQVLPKDTEIALTFGEQLDADGAVEATNVHITPDRFQRVEVVVGDRPVRWQSRFSYAGFRYVQVDGIDRPGDIDLIGCAVHNDVRSVSTFDSSHPVLNWIDQAMRRTVINNLHHLPTDTPMFEKNGWTGDAQVGAESMLYQYDLRSLFGKWLDDLADSQELAATGARSPDGVVREGRLPVIAPSPGWGHVELAPAPEWTTVYPFLLERLTRWYADPTLAPRHLDAVLRYLDYEIGRLDEDGLSEGVLGDYLAPGFGGPPNDDLRLAASCYLYRALILTASLLAESPRRTRLLAAAMTIKDAVNDTFLDGERGCYGSDRETEYRQTTNILPVAIGITPVEQIAAVINNLVADLHAHDDHHNAGCLGLSQLLRVLTDHGQADLALTVATQTTPPSWGAWQAAGETTLREMWNPESRSHNHYFMGTPAQWLYESVAGVRLLEPGWAAFAVDPVARHGLTHASLSLTTVRGEVRAAWRQDDAVFTLDVTVPVGARARVHVPGAGPRWVGSGEWHFASGSTPGG